MEKNESPFWNPNTSQPVTLDELKKADSEMQKDVMRFWFFSNYEDPAERTPYESAEGGYIYIWGGPYTAGYELSDTFGEDVSEKVIDDLVGELESQCYEWTNAFSEDDYDDSYFSIISANTEFYNTFIQNFDNIRVLLETKVEEHLEVAFFRLIYVNVITALETFLSDAFIVTVLAKPKLIRKFVESNSYYKNQKISLSELFIEGDSIKDNVEKHLLSQMWHNLVKVKEKYNATLQINFPNDLGNLLKAIMVRHDIVHRNGKPKEGEAVIITKEKVQELMDQVRELVNHIEDQLNASEEWGGSEEVL